MELNILNFQPQKERHKLFSTGKNILIFFLINSTFNTIMYNEEKAVALNDISLEFKTDDINKATDQSSLSKDKQIEDLLKELLLKDDVSQSFVFHNI